MSMQGNNRKYGYSVTSGSMNNGSMNTNGSMNNGTMNPNGSMNNNGSMNTNGSMNNGTMNPNGNMNNGSMNTNGTMNNGSMNNQNMMNTGNGSMMNNGANQRMMIDNILRELWEQHVMWTRSFIISTIDNLGDLQYVTNRLMENPGDFAAVFKMFYGNQKADEFKGLFTKHLMIGGDLVNAAKNQDTQMANELRENWYDNADEIAKFLAGINPYWNQKEWQNMLYSHLKLTEDEAATRIAKQYKENVELYDAIQAEALKMADYMYRGIANQFNI